MMWFGTEEFMQWVPTPLSGADLSRIGWGANGTLLSGGGYVTPAFGSHKNAVFAWSNASAPEAALLMQGYYEGAWGEGLIYFVDPTSYRTNILPSHWANPTLAINHNAPRLVRSALLPVTSGSTDNFRANRLPLRSITYDVSGIDPGYPGHLDSLFIPVPPGMNLHLGAFHSTTGDGGIFVAPATGPDLVGTPVALTELANDATSILPDQAVAGALGVRLWIGKSDDGEGSVTLSGMIARLVPSSKPSLGPLAYGPWLPGEGHAGSRFVAPPTLIKYSGAGGGQVGYAATFKEVGPWEY